MRVWIEVDGQGIVRRYASSPMPSSVEVEAEGVPLAHYLRAGALQPLPPSPGDWAVFDPLAGVWTDPRTAARQALDTAAALALSRRVAIAGVNRRIGEARAPFITQIPGQEMLYLVKEAEAKTFVVDPAPVMSQYPLITAEVGITGGTALQVAQVWLGRGALWRQIAATLEAMRLTAAAAIDAAPDAAAIDAAVAAFRTTLSNSPLNPEVTP